MKHSDSHPHQAATDEPACPSTRDGEAARLDIADADPPGPAPLIAPWLDNSLSETKRLRQDGWTPERQRAFLDRLSECGVVTDACFATGMSARAAYNLRNRDPLFAAGWDAARVLARQRLADDLYARAVNGVIEQIHRDGAIVGERHRYDNRLSMAVLTRLDARVDRGTAEGDRHLTLLPRWDEYLAALGAGRQDDCNALLDPAAAQAARHRELHELSLVKQEAAAEERDWHSLWEEGGDWWTDYPPPEGFDGEEEGEYGEDDYRRALAPAELAVIRADEAVERAHAEKLRDRYFGLIDEEDEDEDEPEPDAPRIASPDAAG